MKRLAFLLAFAVVAPRVARADAPTPAHVLTKPPALVHFVEADYPPAEKAAGVQATVVLQLDLDAAGHVAAATVTTSAGADFDAAAIAAAKQFVFTPAEVDGAPSPVRVVYQYEFVIHTEVAAKTTADFSGVVRDRDGGAPLAGITVTVGAEHAVTGADGRFALPELAPGRITVTLAGEGVTGLATTEDLEAGKHLDVVYDVAREAAGGAGADSDDLEIVVTAPPIAKATATVEVVAGQARKVPGTGGDVLKVVESMPGVARATAGSGALVVWGAAPEDTRVYVAGVRIPRLYHLGGLRSVIAPDLVGAIALEPGGWGAAHGRGLGGLVDVTLAPLDDHPGGTVQVDAIDSEASVHAPLGRATRLAIAGRVSQLAGVLDHVTSRDVGAFFPIPSYADAQARLTFDPSTREHVEVAAIASRDAETRTVASADPAQARSEEQRISFWRTWAAYHRALDDGALVDAVASVGADASSHVERFGAQPTELVTAARVYGARATWRRAIAGRTTLTLGIDAEVEDARVRRRGSITVPAREGDVTVFGQPPPDELAADRWRVITASAAPFGQLELAGWGDRVQAIAGVRVEPFFTSVSRRTPLAGATPSVGLFEEDATVQPRVAIRADVTTWLRLSAAYGRYRQAPQVEDLSAVFGSPTLPLAEATHVVAGATVQWTSSLSTEVTAFANDADHLAVRSPLATPLLAQALVADGTARARGVQALVRLAPTRGVFGWLSYTLSRAERADAGGVRLFDYDQSHVLTGVASWTIGAGVELGARVRYATGAPRTDVIGAYYDVRADRYEPVFGAHNGARLPAFVQLDARVSKTWRSGRDELEVYLDLQNVTDRDNAEEVVYTADFAERRYITGLPFLPVVGARCTW